MSGRGREEGREEEQRLKDPEKKLEKGNNEKERGKKGRDREQEGERHLFFLVWSGKTER